MLLRSVFEAAWILAFSSSGTYSPRNAFVFGAAVIVGSAVKVSVVSVVVMVIVLVLF